MAPRWNRVAILSFAASLLLSSKLCTAEIASPLVEKMPNSSPDATGLDDAFFFLQGDASAVKVTHETQFLAASQQPLKEHAISGTEPRTSLAFLSSKLHTALRQAHEFINTHMPSSSPVPSKLQTAFRQAHEFIRSHMPYSSPVAVVKAEEPNPSTVPLKASIVYIVFCCSMACLYVMFFKPDKIEEASMETQHESHGFQFGLIDSSKCDCYLVLCACFCPFVRWPATVSNDKLGLIRFWPAVFLFAFLTSELFGGVLTVFFLCAAIYFRQKIRMKYSLTHGTCVTCIEDCLVWMFCYPCAIAQETRQVEFVQSKETNA